MEKNKKKKMTRKEYIHQWVWRENSKIPRLSLEEGLDLLMNITPCSQAALDAVTGKGKPQPISPYADYLKSLKKP